MEAIKSFPTTEEHGKSLTKIRKTLKTTKIKQKPPPNIEKGDWYFTVSRCQKTQSEVALFNITQKHLIILCKWETLEVFERN